MNHLPSDIPGFNASLNVFSALLILGAWAALRSGRTALHRRLMIATLVCSGVFVTASFIYHRFVGPNYYYGLGVMRLGYFFVIASRAITAAVLVPLILRGLQLAWQRRSQEYSRLARWTLPLWLYVSVSSVAVYGLIHRMPTPGLYKIRSRLEAAALLPGAPAWAGTYEGDGGNHGPDEVLTLGTDGYYRRGSPLYAAWGEADPSEDWGTVEQGNDGVLILRSGGWGPPKILRLIPWDDRVYAILDEEKLEFLNAVNARLEPKHRGFVGQKPCKWGGKRTPSNYRLVAKGAPQVPENWRPFLLERPVEAIITKVGPIRYVDGRRRITVEVDAGRLSGLVAEAQLYVRNFDGSTQIILSEVGQTSSSGEAWQVDGGQSFESQRLPWVGQKAFSYSVYGDIWEKR